MAAAGDGVSMAVASLPLTGASPRNLEPGESFAPVRAGLSIGVAQRPKLSTVQARSADRAWINAVCPLLIGLWKLWIGPRRAE